MAGRHSCKVVGAGTLSRSNSCPDRLRKWLRERLAVQFATCEINLITAWQQRVTPYLPEREVHRLLKSASRQPAFVADASGKTVPVSVTVSVCTRNRPEQLRECLKGLARMMPAADEILVVDNTSGDAAAEQLALEFGARYVREPKPGLSRARNLAVAESSSEVVAFLDDDAVPDEKWLGMLLQPFADPQVSTVTGSVVTPDAPPSEAKSPRTLSSRDPFWFVAACFGGLGLGSNMALRKSACKGLTIFDVRLGRGAPFQIAEENYAFARLLSLGHTAVHVPA
ncbi:MAG TPA: glycosyltransferase family 2 protein, partial [Terracidiphilus sp.]|nr:glycosyltransferase family 2 protein [Terracidiphilus sp.]